MRTKSCGGFSDATKVSAFHPFLPLGREWQLSTHWGHWRLSSTGDIIDNVSREEMSLDAFNVASIDFAK